MVSGHVFFDFDINQFIEASLVHSVHVTERRSFRGCRRRWDWIYHGFYYPQVTPKPLEFGIAYHEAMQHWYDPDTWGVDDQSRLVETRQVFIQACRRQFQEYKAKVAKGDIPQYEDDTVIEKDYNERLELGLNMLDVMANASADIDRDYRPMGVETNFEVPIVRTVVDPRDFDPKHRQNFYFCKCKRCYDKTWSFMRQKGNIEFVNPPYGWLHDTGDPRDVYEQWFMDHVWQGLPVTLGGRIDALLLDVVNRIWVTDWKTAARLSTGEPGAPDDFLFLDDQITSYCLALWMLGIDVAGFIYHEQKKAITAEPEPLARPRLGRRYSTNKQGSFDYETYRKTVEENDPEAYLNGLYDEFLEFLKEADPPYKRHIIHRNDTELRNAAKNLALEVEEMFSPSLSIYPSPGRFACNGCAFREPCMAKTRGEDHQYMLDNMFEKRTKLYYETAAPNTDKPARV